MFQRDVGKHTLNRWKLPVETFLNAPQRKLLCAKVLHPCTRIAAIEIARKLIQHDQQSEPTRWCGRPIRKRPFCDQRGGVREAIADCGVELRVGNKPLVAVCRIEPECQHRQGFGRWRRHDQCPTALARLCISKWIDCNRGSWRCKAVVTSPGATRATTRSKARNRPCS